MNMNPSIASITQSTVASTDGVDHINRRLERIVNCAQYGPKFYLPFHHGTLINATIERTLTSATNNSQIAQELPHQLHR